MKYKMMENLCVFAQNQIIYITIKNVNIFLQQYIIAWNQIFRISVKFAKKVST